MLDPKLMRQDPDAVARNLARRGFVLDRNGFVALEARRKSVQIEVESARQERNEKSRQIGQIKADGGDIESIRQDVARLGEIPSPRRSPARRVQHRVRATVSR
jgi:seryl-tRNA synthetase